MAKKRKVHKDLNSEVPFSHNGHRVFGGSKKTSLKVGKSKQKRTSTLINSQTSTGHVRGPLKASAKHKASHKKTVTKA